MSTPHERLLPLILDGITEGVLAVDADFRITYLNAEAEAITGIRLDDAVGRRCYEVLRGDICQTGCALRRSIETGEPQRDVRVDVLDAEMRSVPLLVSTAALRDDDGTLLGGVELFRDISDLESLRSELHDRRGFADIVGVSPPMRALFRVLPDVAESDAAVLIEGDSGTGKELVARAIHDLSPRAVGPFVQVNCGALPDTLLESELFGYVRGAFTDARRDKPGRFQQADGGTLFLDEVGDLSAAFQVKLLRALQEGEVQPLGATRPHHVDVRVVCATNRPLAELVQAGRFREDLYYRLRVIPLRIPPLRERREDLVPLIEHHVARLAARSGKPIGGLSPDALTALLHHDFPGNVRELINLLERAFVLCHGSTIERAHLPAELGLRPAADRAAPAPEAERLAALATLKPSERKVLAGAPLQDGLPEAARRLLEVLHAHGWNRGATAAALGISRSTLWRRMREYGLIEPRQPETS